MRLIHRFTPIALILAIASFVVSCASNPYTGRSQLMLLSSAQELELGEQAYQEQLAQEKRLTEDGAFCGPVERVARRLAAVMEQGWDGVPAPGFQWEFQTIDDPGTVNAWCLPGGKIAVYTGIFPVCQDENGLAVVLGHEIMHAVLRHGNERVSQGMVASVGQGILEAALGNESRQTKDAVATAFGLVVGAGVLMPFSRAHETEADEMGLYLAARAGYDPRAGVEVWKRMGELGGGGPPEFLSTHPSHETRIENMESWMPRAMGLYEGAEQQASAPLPKPGGARLIAGGAQRGHVAVTGSRRETIEDGEGMNKLSREVLVLTFRAGRAIYVKSAEVDGPGDSDARVEGKTGIPGGKERQIRLLGKDAAAGAPAGTYRVKLTGAVDGRAWTEELIFEVR
ncbi:MAG: M48 family metallopeptidase [Candidatus Brocadiae bacterium]|nr:M48 family metallopeptidase [Candidatus Brocadiia bacterium]